MKKLLPLLIVLCYTFHCQAATMISIDTVKKDTAKINDKIKALNAELAGLRSQVAEVQNKIPVDSVNRDNLTSKSHDAQLASKKAAKHAVGGDVSDAKRAEKEAKKAVTATDDAIDAQTKLDDDRKKLKKLNKEIAKNLKKLDKLQSQ